MSPKDPAKSGREVQDRTSLPSNRGRYGFGTLGTEAILRRPPQIGSTFGAHARCPTALTPHWRALAQLFAQLAGAPGPPANFGVSGGPSRKWCGRCVWFDR